MTAIRNLVFAGFLPLVACGTGPASGDADATTLRPADGGNPANDARPSSSADARTYGSIVVDRTSIALFEDIPPEYLAAARDLDMVFSDRSVGQNINESLDCLAADSYEDARSYCKTEDVLFEPDPVLLNRDRWTFEFRQGAWSSLTEGFINDIAPTYLDSKDVLTYQFSYLNVQPGDDIASPATGFFADNSDKYDIFDLEAFIADHPDKIFFFWTTSLARSIGTPEATAFNNQMRDYAAANQKILFDFADIEAHDPEGNPCFDINEDDGGDYPAICADYTTNPEGGHINLTTGRIRVAKAYWVLMAQIAGWQP